MFSFSAITSAKDVNTDLCFPQALACLRKCNEYGTEFTFRDWLSLCRSSPPQFVYISMFTSDGLIYSVHADTYILYIG